MFVDYDGISWGYKLECLGHLWATFDMIILMESLHFSWFFCWLCLALAFVFNMTINVGNGSNRMWVVWMCKTSGRATGPLFGWPILLEERHRVVWRRKLVKPVKLVTLLGVPYNRVFDGDGRWLHVAVSLNIRLAFSKNKKKNNKVQFSSNRVISITELVYWNGFIMPLVNYRKCHANEAVKTGRC